MKIYFGKKKKLKNFQSLLTFILFQSVTRSIMEEVIYTHSNYITPIYLLECILKRFSDVPKFKDLSSSENYKLYLQFITTRAR